MAKNRQRKSKSVTIFDVAKEAGVSYSTVSRVVNGFQFVKEDTRTRVLAAMEKLGYVANLQARSLAGGQSRMIGLLIHDLENSYINEVIKGVDSEISKLDYDLLLATTHQRLQKEPEYVKKLTNGLVDGLIIILPRNLEAYQSYLEQSQFPYIVIEPDHSETQHSLIKSLNWKGAFEASQYLCQLGHLRIAFVKGRTDVASAYERFDAFKEGLQQAGVPVDEELILPGDFTKEGGYEAGIALLSMDNPPTAVFGANDETALGLLNAALDKGVKVPEELSIIGFDDIPQAQHARPALTTVKQNMHQMGKLGIALLIELIEQGLDSPKKIELETQLMVRDSTAPPKT